MLKVTELLPILGLITALIIETQAKGYYTITSPGSVRPNSKYSVHVSVFDVWENSRIRLTLQGPQYKKFTELVVPPNSGQNATFELGDIINGTYSLIAQGLSGIIFENSRNLEFVENIPMVLLQTDKTLYRNSDTIHFRIICLDQYLLPAKINQPISVVLKNSQNVIIERFDDIVLNTGVYKGEHKLADRVVSDEWSVQLFLGQKMSAKKIFEVKDYELPPFEVDLDIPSYVTFKEKQFVVSVRTRNDVNSLASGRCILTIISEINEVIGTIKKPLNNCKKGIPVTLNRLDRVMQNIMVNVTVELNAHNVHTVSKIVRFVPNLYIINMPSMTYECHEQNEVFVYRAHIYSYNGNPIDVDDEVLVTLNPGTNGMAETFVGHVNDEGYLDLQIKCSNYRNIYVSINYEGIRKSGKIELEHLNHNIKEGVHVKTQFPVIDNPIEVQLVSQENFYSFVCVILGRGDIVYSNIIEVPNRDWRQTHTFFITPTYEMMPEAHMFVYFLKNGNMVYYETTFSVKSEFQNTIFLDTPQTIKPGAILSLGVFTERNSYVGLLGMDQDALRIQSENNLNAREIFRDLSNMQSKTSGAIAGLVTMTNANYDLVNTPVTKERAPIRKQATPRNYFETFAFNDYVSISGYDEVVLKLPTTFFKSWIITGFAISPKTGFALTTSTAMKTLKEIYVDIDVPQVVHKGRTIFLKAEVYNYSHWSTRIYVSLTNDKDEFEFIGNVRKKTLLTDIVSPGKSKSLIFSIRPKVNGMITLKLSASCPWASDVNIKKLRVVENTFG